MAQKSSSISPFSLMERSNFFNNISDNLTTPTTPVKSNNVKVNSPILKKDLIQPTKNTPNSPNTQTIVNNTENQMKEENNSTQDSLDNLRKKLQKENWDLKKKNDSQLSQIRRLTEQVYSLENSIQLNEQKMQSHLQLSILWIIELLESFLFVCFPYNNDKQKEKRAKWKKKLMKKLNLNKGSVLAIEQFVTLSIFHKTEEMSRSDVNLISRRNFSDVDLKKEMELSQLLFLIIQKAKENQTKFFELYQRLQLENNKSNTNTNNNNNNNNNTNIKDDFLNFPNNPNYQIMNGDNDFTYQMIGNKYVAVPIIRQNIKENNKENEKNKEIIKNQKKLIKKLNKELEENENKNKNAIKQISNELESLKVEKETLVTYILTYQQQQKQYEDVIQQSSLQVNFLTQENDKLSQQLADLNTNFNIFKANQLNNQTKLKSKRKKDEESQQNYLDFISKLQSEKEKQNEEHQKKIRILESQINQLQFRVNEFENSKLSFAEEDEEENDLENFDDDLNDFDSDNNTNKKKKSQMKINSKQNGGNENHNNKRKKNFQFEEEGEEDSENENGNGKFSHEKVIDEINRYFEDDGDIISDEFDDNSNINENYHFNRNNLPDKNNNDNKKLMVEEELNNIKEEYQIKMNEKLMQQKNEFDLKLRSVIDEFEEAKKAESEENFLLISQLKNEKSNLQFQIDHLQASEEKLQKEINHWKMEYRDLQLKIKQLKMFIEHESSKWNSFIQNYSSKFSD